MDAKTMDRDRDIGAEDRIVGISDKPGNSSPELQRIMERNSAAISEITKKSCR